MKHIFLLLAFCASLCAASPPPPVALCPLVTPAPVMDGVLDEPAWGQAPVNADFQDKYGKAPATPPTRFRLCSDGPWLYVAVELSDPDPASLPRTNLGRDQVRWEETAEVFLAPYADQPLYYQFAVDPGGTDFDNVGQGNACDNNFSWRHAERITDEGWVAEMALPLAELGRPEGIGVGEVMALNVCRETRGTVPLQCWSPTFGQFHSRSAFGAVVVGSFAAAAEREVAALAAQWQSIRPQATDVPPDLPAQGEKVEATLERLRQQAQGIVDGPGWREFKAALSQAAGELRRLALSGKGLVVWRVNPWDLPASDFLPEAGQPLVEGLNLTACQGEYLTVALGVANPTSEGVPLRCVPTDLISPDWLKKVPAADSLRLCQAVEVGLRGGGKQRDALPLLRIEDTLGLPPGYNGLLWLSVNTRRLSPGLWTANLTLTPLVQRDLARDVRVILKVLPVSFPPGPRPYSCNWATYTAPPCDRYPERCHEDQKRHFTSVHIVPIGETGMQTIRYDDQGRPVGEPDFSRLDRWIDTFGTQGQIYVLVGFYEWLPKELGGGGSWGDPQQANFAWFVGKVRGHFAQRGMSVQDFAWYAMDEPCTPEAAVNVVNFGKLLQTADPEQQIFVTVYNAVQMEALRMMAPYVNLWVPSMGLSEEQRQFLRSQKSRFLSYSVLGRTASPYWSYRLDGLRALQYGYEGIGFWNYNDCGGTPGASVWDDSDGTNSDYSVIYEGSEGPVSSVRWEAWRQGIQDYRYGQWLLELADQCPDADLKAQASRLVGQAVADTLNNEDLTTADRYVEQMREMAIRLLTARGQITPAALQGLSQSVPLCLTGNGGLLARNLDPGGSYTYNAYPAPQHYGERSGVTEGPVYFKGRHATAGPQAENRYDGDLTDGMLSYPHDYSIHWWPPATWTITFDLNGTYRLSHALFYTDGKAMRAAVSPTGAEGSWQQTAEIKSLSDAQRSFDGAIYVPLGGGSARYVRFDIDTGGEGVRAGEVRIFGWPGP